MDDDRGERRPRSGYDPMATTRGGGGRGDDHAQVPRVEGDSLVYGLRSVAALLKADPRRIQKLFLDESRSSQPEIAELRDEAEGAGVHVQAMPGASLAAMSRGAVHQGVAAQVAPFRYENLEFLLENTPALLLALDEVTDPQNVGAAARAAWALGGTGLVIPKDRASGVTAAAEKVASGALAHLPVAQVTNLARALQQMRDQDIWIVGLDVDGETDLHDHDFTVPTAIVIGSEHDGMRRLTRESCDVILRIPMAHDAAALNAADAAAVALYEASRQRRMAQAGRGRDGDALEAEDASDEEE